MDGYGGRTGLDLFVPSPYMCTSPQSSSSSGLLPGPSPPYLAAAVGSVGQPLLRGAVASGRRHPFLGCSVGLGRARRLPCACLPSLLLPRLVVPLALVLLRCGVRWFGRDVVVVVEKKRCHDNAVCAMVSSHDSHDLIIGQGMAQFVGSGGCDARQQHNGVLALKGLASLTSVMMEQHDTRESARAVFARVPPGGGAPQALLREQGQHAQPSQQRADPLTFDC